MKKVGIIGGLGPLATVDFFEKIVRNTDVKRDQDNIPVLIYNNPQIPDRTDAILHGGESPVSAIINTGRVLEKMGADFLCIPCNTSFYFYDEIQKGLKLKLLNMVDLTVDYLKNKEYKKVCLLGTAGTLKAGVYKKKLISKDISFYDVSDYMVEVLTEMIYEVVKKNRFDSDISSFKFELERIRREEGVDVFVLACTELPVLFDYFKLDYETVDPTLLLAKEAIRLANGN